MSAPGPETHGGEAAKVVDLAALQNLQSIEWLMKKDRILFVLKYWQQRTALAENEVHTLQEQLENYRGGHDKENINNNNTITTNSNSSEPPAQQPPTQTPDSERSKTPIQENFAPQTKEKEVSRLVDDISRLQSALSDAKEATSAQMSALEEELANKTKLMQKIDLKTEKDPEELRKELARNVRDIRGVFEGGAALGLHPRSLDGLLMDRNKLDQELKSTDFGNSLSHLGAPPFHQPLRPPMHPQLGTPLPPPPLISPFQPLPQGPHGAPFHHLLNEEWRRSFGRTHENNLLSSSGQTSPEHGITNHTERSKSRESPMGEMGLKSPPTIANGFMSDSKSPYHIRDNRSPFKEEGHLFKFEDRITGESLIPKGDPMEARLQEILRYNMDKYCHQNLDTLHISRRVRELLSIHNIGQRLFAKYVLGLSQGTVSELLSKPKCWDKLTEKGRDSYRKMHAWATDDHAVYLLKSLIPKKGTHKECVRGGPEENVSEDRIQHILTEASRAMTSSASGLGVSPIPCSLGTPLQQPNASIAQLSHQQPLPPSTNSLDQDSRSTDSKSPASSTHSPSPISRDGRRVRKDLEDLSQDKVAKIYQEELLKLMSRAPQPESLGMSRDAQYPNLLFPFLGQSLIFNRNSEDMRLALDAYHQELSKIQGIPSTGMGLGAGGLGLGCSPAGSGPIGLGLGANPPISMGVSLGAGGHNGAEDLSLPKRESRTSEEEDESAARISSVASPFGLARMKAETSISMTSVSPLSNLVTPICSISSAGTTTSNGADETASTTASPLQRMASITNSLMTGAPLSGGAGLAQKPMKAVLPPITQQQFDQYSNMNTEDIVKKVKEQLSQFSISQRLFGESVLGLSQGSVSDLLARPKPWHMLTQKGREPFIRMKIFLEDDNAVHKLVASQYKIAPEKLMRTGGYGSTSSSKSHHIKLPPDLPKTSMESSLPPVGIPSSLALSMPPHSGFEPRLAYLDPLRKGFPFQPNVGMRPGIASSVYELAALTQDLDTQAITTKIKEALLANNIGQKLFGEAILGLSQGSVSELLSKPKPWHMLSIKGREPFIRMHMWMSDPTNIEKLQQLKNQRREANKRRRALDPSMDMSQDSQDLFQVPSPGGSSKKARVLFTEEQKEAMRIAFNLDSYPNTAAIEFLSQELQLSTRTIANWFHNHRMRLRQNASSPDGGMSSPTREIPCQPQNQFDPIQFRLVLSQRLMELRKEKGLPPSLPGLGPGLPPGLHPGFFPHMPPFSVAGLGLSQADVYHGASGLDLTMKSDQEGDDSNVSFVDEDSNMSGGMSPVGHLSENEDCPMDRSGGTQSPAGRPSSRRKPAAPQWVNPSWQGDKDTSGDKDVAGEKEKEVIINGVCVMQTGDYRQDTEQETVHIEPTPVTDESRRLAMESRSPVEGEDEGDRVSSPTMDTSYMDDAESVSEERLERRDIEPSYLESSDQKEPPAALMLEEKAGCEA